MSSQKEGVIREFFSNYEEGWVFKWERLLNSDEIIELLDMWSIVCRFSINFNLSDSWRWAGSLKGSFKTKDMYQIIMASELVEVEDNFSW